MRISLSKCTGIVRMVTKTNLPQERYLYPFVFLSQRICRLLTYPQVETIPSLLFRQMTKRRTLSNCLVGGQTKGVVLASASLHPRFHSPCTRLKWPLQQGAFPSPLPGLKRTTRLFSKSHQMRGELHKCAGAGVGVRCSFCQLCLN